MILLLFTFKNVYWSNFRERVKGKTETVQKRRPVMQRDRAISTLDLYIKLIPEPLSEIIAKKSKVKQKRSCRSKTPRQKNASITNTTVREEDQ